MQENILDDAGVNLRHIMTAKRYLGIKVYHITEAVFKCSSFVRRNMGKATFHVSYAVYIITRNRKSFRVIFLRKMIQSNPPEYFGSAAGDDEAAR
mmetsp:Transcript_9394/g.13787  ORF Transcript_9394/g.13787 Transcript_9394/m.13787 type:complete len:95 (+) Transcript_9394:919-1203(+)